MTLTAELNLIGAASGATRGVGATSDVLGGVSSQTPTQLIAVDATWPRLDIFPADLSPECTVLRIDEPHQNAVARIREALQQRLWPLWPTAPPVK